MIKKIAILTSGGDAPGMNTAVKSLVESSIDKGIEPYLVYEGYLGLTEGNFKKVTKDDVKDFADKGGTAIYSARYPEFKDVEVRKIAVEKLNAEGIDALVAIGGDGSYMGAAKLTEMGIRTIGLPGTIDNDIASTDYTIGYFTALDTIKESISKVRDTSESHKRANIVEVMGRHCGDLAIQSSIDMNVEVLSVPERKLSEDEILTQIKEWREKGHRSIIVVVTELMYDVFELAKKVENETGIETRATIVGHTQRGGAPVKEDRELASKMSEFAIDKLIEGETGVAVNIINNELSTKDILEVVEMERPSRDEWLNKYDSTKK